MVGYGIPRTTPNKYENELIVPTDEDTGGSNAGRLGRMMKMYNITVLVLPAS